MTSIGSGVASPQCSERIPIIPVRYGVVPKMEGDRQTIAYQDAPYRLETGFRSISNLRRSKYTLRMLRRGYIYVFMNGPCGRKVVIHEHSGGGMYHELRVRSLAQYRYGNQYAGNGFSHRDNYQEAGAGRFTVWAERDATEVWIGFSSHLWTDTRIAEIETNAGKRADYMQPLDLAELTDGASSPSTQADVIPVEAMREWVEEYKRDAMPMDWSHSNDSPAAEASFDTLMSFAAGYRHTRPKVPVVAVLRDAEGITQDLGAIANLYAHQVNDIRNPDVVQQRPRGSGGAQLPPAMRLDVESLHVNSDLYVRRNIAATVIKQSLISFFPADSSRDPWQEAGQDEERFYDILTRNHRDTKSGARFAKRVNDPEYKTFLRQRKQAQQQIETLLASIEAAAADHDDWLKSLEASWASNRLSVARELMRYDRDVKISATALEFGIAQMMDGMGLPLAKREENDPRYQRLGRWVNDPQSPLYLALAGYKPFADENVHKALLTAADGVIDTAGKQWVQNAATAILVRNVSQLTMSRVVALQRVTVDTSMTLRIGDAIVDLGVRRVLGLLRTRYVLTESQFVRSGFTSEVRYLIDNDLLRPDAPTRLNMVTHNGRRVRLITSEDIRFSATDRMPLTRIAAHLRGGVNSGLLLLNAVALWGAAKKSMETPDLVNYTTVVSSVVGTLGAISGAICSARDVVVRRNIRTLRAFPGQAFERGLLKMMRGKAFGKALGWGGIIIDAAKDAQLIARSGNATQQAWRTTAMVSGAASAVLIMSAGSIAAGVTSLLGGAAVSAAIPVVGWVVAVVLVLVAAGISIWAAMKADGENDTPIERWANRCIFGAGRKDETGEPVGEYADQTAEMQGYYNARYTPTLLNEDASKEIVGETGGSDYYTRGWFTRIFRGSTPDVATWYVLLPDYDIAISDYRGNVGEKRTLEFEETQHDVPAVLDDAVDAEAIATDEPLLTQDLEPIVVTATLPWRQSFWLTDFGLVAKFVKVMEADSPRPIHANFTYRPNLGFDPRMSVSESFVLGN